MRDDSLNHGPHWKPTAGVLFALLVLAGCSATPAPVRLYECPERPPDRVSSVRFGGVHFITDSFRDTHLFRPIMYLSLIEFDGRSVSGDAGLEVEPGSHRAKIWLWSQALWASRWERIIEVDFVAESGKVYHVFAFGQREIDTDAFKCDVVIEELSTTPAPAIVPPRRYTLGGKVVAHCPVGYCRPG